MDAPFTWMVSYEQFVEIWTGMDSRPPFVRRPLIAIALTWLFIALIFLLMVPAARDDAGAVARSLGIALVAAIWWSAWFQMSNIVQRWLLGHPGLGERRRMVMFLAAFAFYPLASFVVLILH